MAKRLIVALGDITLVEMNEPGNEDEVYVIGSVQVRNGNREVRPDLSKYFVSPNVMIFKPTHVGIARPLSPQGEVYNEVLDDTDTALLTMLVVEHDAASTVRDINKELIAFIRQAGSQVEGIPGTAEFTQFLPAVELLTQFVQTISNIFDRDDIMGMFVKKYPQRTYDATEEFSANMDVGEYTPVTVKVSITTA